MYVSVTARVGIDLGLKEFAITSSGKHVPNPKFFRESERKLAKLQVSSFFYLKGLLSFLDYFVSWEEKKERCGKY